MTPETKRTVTVRVEQSHIDKGYYCCHELGLDPCYNDPIALALNDATGEECSVGYANIRVGRGEMIPMEEQVLEWKKMFDKSWILGVEENPLPFGFEFQLEI